MNFEEARAEYTRLRQGYDSRQISAEEYGRRVQGLQVREPNGTYWTINSSTGEWLRYDGSAWVPGQPPIPQSAPQGQFGAATVVGSAPPSGFGQPGGNFGQPQQQGQFGQQPQGQFGQQPQGQFGAPAAGGYNAGQPYAGVPTAPAKKSRRGLAIGCSAVAVLLLVCVGVGGLLLARSGSGALAGLGGGTGLTEIATARTLDGSKPGEKTGEFNAQTKMYITYTARSVKKNEFVDLKLFRNGTPVVLSGDTTTTFDKDATFYGYYSYTPTEKGTYRAEIFYKGEATPSQTVEFTVK